MAIEIIPKTEEKETSIPQVIFSSISMILLIIAIGGTFVFWFLGQRLERIIQETEGIIESKKTIEFLKMDAQAREYQKKIDDYIILLDVTRTPLEMFKTIEEKIHPEVVLSQMKINLSQGEISTNGVADNLVAYDQQVGIFKNETKFSKVDIPNFSIMEGGKIGFPITFSFGPDVYKRIK